MKWYSNREVLDAQTFMFDIIADLNNMHVQKLAYFLPALHHPNYLYISLQTRGVFRTQNDGVQIAVRRTSQW